MYGINDTSFKKFRVWRGTGAGVSPNSRLGMEISASNKNERCVSKHEVERLTCNNKTFNALYFWPLPNILEIMARSGKINGIYLNMKQGWYFHDVTHEEIKTKNKLAWKVRYEKYEDFLEDIDEIKNYRIYHTDINTNKSETINFIHDMLREEWTMNVIDGNVTKKQLWQKYRMDTIKFMNLEFRLKDDAINKGVTEIPIVFCEDNGDYKLEKYDEKKLQLLENKWRITNGESNIPSKKKKRQIVQKVKGKTKQIRCGTEELLEVTLKVKKLLLSLKTDPISNSEMMTLDKFDQIKEISRTIFDEETKEKMNMIIMSRKDKDDLKYKVLEETLLSGKNYMIRMPKIETIRTNILGMVQEIESNAPESWEDNSLEQRLQIVTGNRMKKLLNRNLEEMVKVLVTFRKEMEIVNELKNQCETKEKFDIVQFNDLLKQIIGEKEYDNERIDFMDRWCEEIEINIERGMKKASNCNKKEETVQRKQLMCSTVKKASKRRFVLSSDSEDSFVIPKTAKMMRPKRNEMRMIKRYDTPSTSKNDTIVISSDSCQDVSNSDSNSDIIPREKVTYLTFSSDEE